MWWESKVVPHGASCHLKGVSQNRLILLEKCAWKRGSLFWWSQRCRGALGWGASRQGGRVTARARELEILAQLWSVCAKKKSVASLFSFFNPSSLSCTKHKDTLLKTNMEPGNASLEKEKHLQNTFWGYMRNSGFGWLWGSHRSHRLCKEHSDWALYMQGRLGGIHFSQDHSSWGSKVNNEATCNIPQTIKVWFHQPQFLIQGMLLFGWEHQLKDWAPIFDFWMYWRQQCILIDLHVYVWKYVVLYIFGMCVYFFVRYVRIIIFSSGQKHVGRAMVVST